MEWASFIKDRDISGAFVNSMIKLQVLVDAENLQTGNVVHFVNWLTINTSKFSFLNNNNNNNNNNNKSRRQGDYTVEPASANGQNYPQ